MNTKQEILLKTDMERDAMNKLIKFVKSLFSLGRDNGKVKIDGIECGCKASGSCNDIVSTLASMQCNKSKKDEESDDCDKAEIADDCNTQEPAYKVEPAVNKNTQDEEKPEKTETNKSTRKKSTENKRKTSEKAKSKEEK